MLSNAFPLTRKSVILSKEAIRLVWHNLPLVDRRQMVRCRWGGNKKKPIHSAAQPDRQWLQHAGTIDTIIFCQENNSEGFKEERIWRRRVQNVGMGKAMNLMTTITSMAVDTLNDEQHGKGEQEARILFTFLIEGELRNQIKPNEPVFTSHNK